MRTCLASENELSAHGHLKYLGAYLAPGLCRYWGPRLGLVLCLQNLLDVFPAAPPRPVRKAGAQASEGLDSLLLVEGQPRSPSPSTEGNGELPSFSVTDTLTPSLPRKTGVMCQLLNHNFCYMYTQHLNSL